MDAPAPHSTLPVALLTACDAFRQELGDFVTAAGGTVCAASAHVTVLERLLLVRDAAVLVTDSTLLVEARSLATAMLPLLLVADTLGGALHARGDGTLAGVLVRPLTQTAFVTALCACAQGQSYRPRALTLPFADWVLSERQQEMLILYLQGATTKEIALQLGIDPHTVRSQKRYISDRLGVESVEQLRATATRWWQQTWLEGVPLRPLRREVLRERYVAV